MGANVCIMRKNVQTEAVVWEEAGEIVGQGQRQGCRVWHVANIDDIHKLLRYRSRRTNLRLSTMFISPKALTIFFSPNDFPKLLLLKIIAK